MSPFDIIKVLGKSSYEDLSKLDKSSNFFIINRILGRIFPDISSVMSHMNMSQSHALDFWHFYFKKLYSNKINPLNNDGIYKSIKENKNTDITEEVLLFIINKLEINKDELNILRKLNKSGFEDYIKRVDNLLKDNEAKVKRKNMD